MNKNPGNSPKRRAASRCSALFGDILSTALSFLVCKLRNLGYQFVFLAYDLAILSIAFFMRRPRLRKIGLKLLRGHTHLAQSQPDDAGVNLAIEQWVNTVDQLYYIHGNGWLNGKWGKTPNNTRTCRRCGKVERG